MKLSEVIEVYDAERGCGWRKGGGLYFMCEGTFMPCGKLPIPLEVCPVCGEGIKFARSWTWINPSKLVEPGQCKMRGCEGCVLSDPPEKAGLLWIGGKFYPTPETWMRESMIQGVSRRIQAVPHGFVLGETWILVAHKSAILSGYDPKGKPLYKPGVFQVFRPTRIEYVCKGDETEEELDNLVERGITPVKVKKKNETDQELFDSPGGTPITKAKGEQSNEVQSMSEGDAQEQTEPSSSSHDSDTQGDEESVSQGEEEISGETAGEENHSL